MKTPASWSSKIGFILSAAGSAIGLGAIWKFPYTAGTNGGAVFVLMFLVFTILVALPVQLAEFYIGRKSGKNAVDAFKTLAPNSLWPWIGRMGVFACFILLSFYSVVGGWVLNYVVHAFDGSIHQNADFNALFGSTISNPVGSIAYQGLFMLMTVWVVKSGIAAGIERANKYMMPALFVLLLLLAVRSLTLDGAMAGISFLLKPDWSHFTPQTMLTALGQAFFALSLGVSTMITYAAYLDKKQDLFRSGNSIMWMNLLVSLLAGLVIFPAVFAFNFEPGQGPGLIFVVLPAAGANPVCRVYAAGGVRHAHFRLLHAGNRDCRRHPRRRKQTQQNHLDNRHGNFYCRHPLRALVRRTLRMEAVRQNTVRSVGLHDYRADYADQLALGGGVCRLDTAEERCVRAHARRQQRAAGRDCTVAQRPALPRAGGDFAGVCQYAGLDLKRIV